MKMECRDATREMLLAESETVDGDWYDGILVLALLGLGIINRGHDFDVPHTAHNTYEPEPTLAVSDYASGSSTATISNGTLEVRGLSDVATGFYYLFILRQRLIRVASAP
jgi:hypothetical protein